MTKLKREPLTTRTDSVERLRGAIEGAKVAAQCIQEQSDEMSRDQAREAFGEAIDELYYPVINLIEEVHGDAEPRQFLRFAEQVLKYVTGK